ncbi:hypothetical protein NP493_2537g00001 [Ridgeia piscesae]|uniref:Uncharacterized protein n=1 Tax=Ridgeia piscesae TaxID=27915 RepID=A0AAD9JFN8_RIDPI|nr:hypothetical protein NP493_2537g00001 [Ridgeia piscesae]
MQSLLAACTACHWTDNSLCSILNQPENLGSVALCRYYNLTCTAQFAGAGNISISQVRGCAKKGGGRRDKARKMENLQ